MDTVLAHFSGRQRGNWGRWRWDSDKAWGKLS